MAFKLSTECVLLWSLHSFPGPVPNHTPIARTDVLVINRRARALNPTDTLFPSYVFGLIPFPPSGPASIQASWTPPGSRLHPVFSLVPGHTRLVPWSYLHPVGYEVFAARVVRAPAAVRVLRACVTRDVTCALRHAQLLHLEVRPQVDAVSLQQGGRIHLPCSSVH